MVELQVALLVDVVMAAVQTIVRFSSFRGCVTYRLKSSAVNEAEACRVHAALAEAANYCLVLLGQ